MRSNGRCAVVRIERANRSGPEQGKARPPLMGRVKTSKEEQAEESSGLKAKLPSTSAALKVQMSKDGSFTASEKSDAGSP